MSEAGTDLGTPMSESSVQDERLRLFSFTTARNRAEYLTVLRAFDHARANYAVLLHAGEVAEILDRLAGRGAGVAHLSNAHLSNTHLSNADISALLEQLHGWGVLERSYDGARAATLAEYRNRHFVYQFSQGGYLVYRAVEEVLGAGGGDASLSRLVLPELLSDLEALAAANLAGDAEQVYRRLTRLDSALSEMATRAAHFYLMLGDLVRTTDVTPEAFLVHKDALLSHMREFSSDLARFAPRLAEAIHAVERTGLERLLELASGADERLFRSRAERVEDWRARWSGLVHWFAADGEQPSETERLREGTMTAISAVLALLRRVTEAKRGGVSRESQLRHLAGWFANSPTEQSAHALFETVFGLGRPRHLSTVHPDADIIPATRSWWDAAPVAISRTLAETGRAPSAGVPARVLRNDGGQRRMRDAQLAAQRARKQAAQSLAAGGVADRVLDEQETEVLLSLLNAALTARVPVSAQLRPAESTGSDSGVRLTLRPHTESTTVRTARGLLHLDRLAVSVQ